MQQHIKYRTLAFGGILLLSVLSFSSCVKSRTGETDFSGLKPVVLIPEGGLAAFSSQALTFPGTDVTDTASFYVNYAATNVAPADEAITIAIDPTALATYNSSSSIQYQLFPDSIFSFTTTTVTVKKGDNYTSAIPLAVFPIKIDPTKNYMLPISIKAVPAGATVSTNFGTIYYHLIGNPIAGAYNQEWIRYNTATQTGSPAYDQTGSAVFAPDNPTQIEVASGTSGITYVLSFTNTAGVLSNFQVSFPASGPGSAANAGITITGGPTIVTADPINKKYQFNFTYTNSLGAPRNITDKFY